MFFTIHLRTVHASVVAAILFVSMIACDEAEPGFDPGRPLEETVHPAEDALLSSDSDAPVEQVSLDEPGGELDSFGLGSFDEDRAIGVLDGPDERTLGSIRDADILPDGRVALVDGDYGTVRVLTSAMEPVELVGSFGDGPGEFVDPVAVLGDPDGGFHVVNRMTSRSRLESFRPSGGAGYEFAERRPSLPMMVQGGTRFCRVGEREYATGLLTREVTADGGRTLGALDDAGWIHEIDAEGEVLNSFGTPYPALFERTLTVEDEAETEQGRSLMMAILEVGLNLASARLACDDDMGGRVVAAYEGLGEVHAYTSDGELEWIVDLADVSPPRILQRDFDFGSSVGGDPSGPAASHRVTHLSLLSPELLAVQVRADGEMRTFRTYLLDPADGRLLGGFEGDHQVIGGGDGRAVLYREDPYPQASVIQVHEASGG